MWASCCEYVFSQLPKSEPLDVYFTCIHHLFAPGIRREMTMDRSVDLGISFTVGSEVLFILVCMHVCVCCVRATLMRCWRRKRKTAVLYLPHWWSLIKACLGACVRTHFACVLAPPISHSMYFLGSRNTRKNLKPWFARLHNAAICVFLCGMINPKVYQFIT